nr:upf0057 membrane protein [Quercus suber]
MANGCEIFCEILIAILLPPLGVCLRHGCCSVEFWLCVLLTILVRKGVLFTLPLRTDKSSASACSGAGDVIFPY